MISALKKKMPPTKDLIKSDVQHDQIFVLKKEVTKEKRETKKSNTEIESLQTVLKETEKRLGKLERKNKILLDELRKKETKISFLEGQVSFAEKAFIHDSQLQ